MIDIRLTSIRFQLELLRGDDGEWMAATSSCQAREGNRLIP